MQLREATYGDARPVDGYGPGFFRVGGAVLRGPVLVTPGSAGGWTGLDDTAAIGALAGEIDVLVLGTGGEMAPVPQPLAEAAEAAGIGVEPMATPSACRVFNVLLAEGRRVALAAVPV